MAKQALAVNEAAITAVSNNISNVDTPGYSKLRVNLASVVIKSSSSTANNVITGVNSLSGVEVSSISRYSNTYLQSSYWGANSDSSYMNEYSNIASNIESLTNELQDSGLSTALSNFYSSIDALAAAPNDATARGNYLTAAQNVCTMFNSTGASLSDIKESLVGNGDSTDGSELSSSVDQVNGLLDQLANINSSIIKTGGATNSASSSGLLDQRDSLVTQLSSLMNVNVTQNANGTVGISLGNDALVSSSSVVGYLNAANSVDISGNTVTTMNIVDKKGTTIYPDVNDSITSGSIGAILDSCGTNSDNLTISNVTKGLDTLAQSFANALNIVQRDDPDGDGSVPMCITTDGTNTLSPASELIAVNKNSITTTTTTSTTGQTTTTISSSSAGITAADIAINPNVVAFPNKIAAARLSASEYQDWLATGEHSQDTGNNKNATILQTLRTAKLTQAYDSDYNITDLGNNTIDGYLANIVGNVGTKTENINTSLTTQTSVVASIKSQLSSETGVNLDEELTDLIKYQRAYEASARIFSTCSSILQELVMLGK